VFLYTDTTNSERSVIYWVFNDGEKLLFASQPPMIVNPDTVPYIGVESSLSSKPTSYPHLLYHEPGDPKLIVSRSGTFSGGVGPGDDVPSLIVITKEEDLDANPNMLQLRTELGMLFTNGSEQLMHVQWSTPVVVQASDTIEIIRYDYLASKAFTSEPIDTLSRTIAFQLTDQDAALFALDITCVEPAADTIVIEAFLVDPASGNPISSSGEIKYAPFAGDTAVVVGLELPNGFPPTDCLISTSITRGYIEGGSVPDINLARYMLFKEYYIPKRSYREERSVPRDYSLQVFPQPARDELRFVFEGAEDATVMLCDLLGRRLRELPVRSNGRSAHGRIGLTDIPPGIYVLVAQTQSQLHTRKVIVTQ
jgi:hypothetical protein